MNTDDAVLHDWVFHYNVFNNTWAAIPRELYQAYWSDYNAPGIIRSKSHDTLVSIIKKTKGDPDAIEKLIKKK
jgi:hypothetical protein